MSELDISSPAISCFNERANLSSFQTTITSTEPRRHLRQFVKSRPVRTGCGDDLV